MSTNKKRLLIPVFSLAMVALMALTSVLPALAFRAVSEPVLSPADISPVEPAPPKSYLYVAKIGYRDLPTFSFTHRHIAIHVVIANQDGKGEPGAQVTGWLDIPSADIDPFVGLTDSNGQVVFKALIPKDSQGKFCVVDVSKKDSGYDPGKNFQTCFDILPR